MSVYNTNLHSEAPQLHHALYVRRFGKILRISTLYTRHTIGSLGAGEPSSGPMQFTPPLRIPYIASLCPMRVSNYHPKKTTQQKDACSVASVLNIPASALYRGASAQFSGVLVSWILVYPILNGLRASDLQSTPGTDLMRYFRPNAGACVAAEHRSRNATNGTCKVSHRLLPVPVHVSVTFLFLPFLLHFVPFAQC